jgi:general secretion pathway protein B
MSLILEALRKSEAERQIGRAPGLLTPVALRPAQRSRARGPLLFAAALLLLAALALAWWLGRSAAEPPAAVPAEAPAMAPATSAASAASATTDVPTRHPTHAATPPTAAPATSAPPRSPLPAAGPGDLPADPDFASTERESLPLPPPVSALPAPPPPPAATAPLPETAPAPIEAEGATPWRTLSEAERAGLPPLRLNMHVFNDEPARRFVIIDGRRLAEGEQIAADVVLTEIRRDGAMLVVRGRRISIERP